MPLFKTMIRDTAIALALLSAVPVLGAEPAPSLELYGRLPGFENAALSPSGDRIALIGVVKDERRLIVLNKDMKPLTTVPLGDRRVRSLVWAGEKNVLMRIAQTVTLNPDFLNTKVEMSNVAVVDVDSGKSWNVFASSTDVAGGVRGVYGFIERGGRWYGYFGGITLERGAGSLIKGAGSYFTDGRSELYEVDLETHRARLIAHRPTDKDTYRDWVIGSDGAVVATLDFSKLQGDWQLRNAAQKVIASGRAPTGQIELYSVGRTADTVVYRVEDKDGVIRAFEQPLAGGSAAEILDNDSSHADIVDGRSRQLIGFVRDGDILEDHFFDPQKERRLAATRKAFPDRTVRLIGWNDNFDRLILQTSGGQDPEGWWLIDARARSASPLGVGYPLPPEQVGPTRMIRYKATDGVELTGVLTLPPERAASKLPVVIMPHSIPIDRDYPVFDWMAQAFASRGYAVLQPNFRGSNGYGDAFRRAGYAQWGRKMQTDISDGLAALAREGTVDPSRACIVGAGYGGYAALAGITLQNGLYRCAVSIAGLGDLLGYYNNRVSSRNRDETTIRALKEVIGSGRTLDQISPVHLAAKADAPVLLVHGVDDLVYPYDQSRDMAGALRAAGKPVELVTLKGEDHWLSKSETRNAMLKAAVAFVEKHNPPDPAK